MRASFRLPWLFLGPGLVAAPTLAQSPQVTSEKSCTTDADCPRHDGCWWAGWPGCGCDEGAHHCDPNPEACDAANDCFGQEVCASSGHCIEPGPPPGSPCNSDAECAAWMSCLLGQCSRGDCVEDGDCQRNFACDRNQCVRVACSRDADCSGGEVCRDRECREVRCVADDECGAQAVCSGGTCHAVECRNEGQCPPCSLCTAEHRCESLCREGESCFGFASASPPRFIVHLCKEPGELTCTSSTACPLGQRCLGGRCVDLRSLIGDLERRQRDRP